MGFQALRCGAGERDVADAGVVEEDVEAGRGGEEGGGGGGDAGQVGEVEVDVVDRARRGGGGLGGGLDVADRAPRVGLAARHDVDGPAGGVQDPGELQAHAAAAARDDEDPARLAGQVGGREGRPGGEELRVEGVEV